jgi:tRNA (guanine37-N1)-methyltransferase
MGIRFDILTLFPEYFSSPLGESLLGKAIKKGIVEVRITNIRDFATDKHKTVDDIPFGGGAGMVMKPEPIILAIESVEMKDKKSRKILLSPDGHRFDQRKAMELLNYDQVILVCGRYEGVDERVRQFFVDEDLSIGDYVLNGGEAAALVILETTVRLIDGVVGNKESLKNDTFTNYLLDYPQYTRPREFRGYGIPEVLLSGNHSEIQKWRRRAALERTFLIRPDLIEITIASGLLSEEEIEFVKNLKNKINN